MNLWLPYSFRSGIVGLPAAPWHIAYEFPLSREIALTPPLILASASPRRRDLLARLGVPFTIVPSDVPEQPEHDEVAADFARRVACEKAVKVARLHPDAVVLAADT